MAVRDAAIKTWGKSKGITDSDEEGVPVRNLKGGKEDLVVMLCSTLKPNVKLMQK